MALSAAMMRKAMTIAIEAVEGAARAVRTRNVGGWLEMVEIEGGAVAMGSNAIQGNPTRLVGLTDHFIGRTAVTEAQWRRLVAVGEDMEKARFAAMRRFRMNPNTIDPVHPAVCVSHDDALAFIGRLNASDDARQARLVFSLPAEVQQEFLLGGRMVDVGAVMKREGVVSNEAAVRAFVDNRLENFLVFPPDTLPEVGGAILTIDGALPAIIEGRNQILARRVFGTLTGKAPTAEEAWFNRPGLTAADWGPLNPQGVKGRPGGVWEWGTDWHGDLSRADFVVNPLGPASGEYRVLRGGSFYLDPDYLRAAYRNIFHPPDRHDFIGFRLAAVPQGS